MLNPEMVSLFQQFEQGQIVQAVCHHINASFYLTDRNSLGELHSAGDREWAELALASLLAGTF